MVYSFSDTMVESSKKAEDIMFSLRFTIRPVRNS